MPNLTRSPLLRTLAETDPEIAAAVTSERRRQSEGLELIASENFVSAAILETAGSVLTNKYAEGYPGQALLRRLRVRGRGRVAGDRAGEGALRRRPRQRAAALRRPGQHVGVLRGGETGRHRARHEPGPRRPPHARPPAQLLGPALHDRAVRRAPGHRADRLRRARTPGARAQAEDDRRRGERLPAHHRLRAHRRRGQGRGLHRDGGHGPHRRPRRRGPPPEPDPLRGFRHVHDAQDAARPARRPRPVPRAVRQGPRPRALSRRAGRAVDAHHRGQGGVLQGSAGAVLRRLSAADRGECGAARVGAHRARASGW